MGRTRKTELNTAPIENEEKSETKETSETKVTKVIPLIAKEDVPLKKGKIIVPTSIVNNKGGLIVSTHDNTLRGLCVEGDRRLMSSYVISMYVPADSEIDVVLNINDEVDILRLTQFGTRMDILHVPAGTHIADFVVIE